MATAFSDTIAPYRERPWRQGSSSLLADSIYKGHRGTNDAERRTAPSSNPQKLAKAQSPSQVFQAAYQQWIEDTLFDSLPSMMRDHASYRKIVGLGERAIPLIAAELDREPSFIFIALEDITGVDPVGEEALGNLEATTDAWLTWLHS